MDFLCIEGAGRESAHAACVEAGISVTDPLMVLGGCHQLIVLSIHKSQGGYFTACHKLFNHDLVARGAELLIDHQLGDAGPGLFAVFADQDALAQGQSGCLEDDGISGCFQICQGLFSVIKYFISGRRDAVLLHQVLGKGLAAFNDGRVLPGAEHSEACRLKSVRDAGAEGIIHADDSQVNGLFPREGCQFLEFHDADRDTFRDTGNARVSGRAVEFVHPAAPDQGCGDRVLSSAAAHK